MTNLEGQRMDRTYLLGNLVSSETRFDGSAVSYSYDSNANIVRADYPDATLAFTHDADGLLTSASNSAGVISNEYDSATGWLISSRGIDGSDVSYGYHLGGGVASMASPAGVVSNTLDAAGRKSVLFTSAGNIGFGYCPWNGKLAVVTNANGTTTSYAYDVMDRVTNITWSAADGSRIGGFSYVYDAIGRIVSRNHDISTNTFNRSYAYDAMDRLASDGNVSYVYDVADNRIAKTGDVEGDVSYTFGTGNRLQSWTGGSYTYDDAGCVTRIERVGKPTLSLTWNSQYQLISVATNGIFAEGYAYDALGRRVATTTLEGVVRHVYDNNWQCIADVGVTGNVLRSYVWGDGIDNLLAVRIGDETYTALTDIQGTVWGFTDGNGEVVARWTYDAWGNVLSSNVSVTALASLRYRFQGRELSAVTGLMNFRMRWYDVVTGRWLSKDPIGLLGGGNNYVFCCDVPLMFFDILGTCPERPQLRRRLGPPPKPRKPRTKSATIVGARAAATLGITAAISALVDSEGNVGIGFTGGVGVGVEADLEFGTAVSVHDGTIYDQEGGGVEGHVGFVVGMSFDPTATDADNVITGGEIGGIGGGVYATETVVLPLPGLKFK